MMEISQLGFVLLAVYSLTFGLMLGIIYDVIRITRVLIGAETKTKSKWRIPDNIKLPIINKNVYYLEHTRAAAVISNIYIAVGDILFVSACGMCSVLIAYAYNSGRMRAVIFLGLAAGFQIYYNTIGRLVMSVSSLAAFVIRVFVTYVVELLKLSGRQIIMIKKKVKKKGAKKDAKQDVIR